MGDMKEDFQILKRLRQDRHAEWKEKNLTVIKASEFDFIDKDETLLFRCPNKPKVDFYPSTGRWRLPTKNKTFSGGAKNFLKWYRKQYANRSG